MTRQVTGLSDAERARIEPLLPRGPKGAHRVTGHSGIRARARRRSTPPTARRTAQPPAQKGAYSQAIGKSRGGRTTKFHGLTDDQGRSRVLQLSAGNINDMTAAPGA